MSRPEGQPVPRQYSRREILLKAAAVIGTAALTAKQTPDTHATSKENQQIDYLEGKIFEIPQNELTDRLEQNIEAFQAIDTESLHQGFNNHTTTNLNNFNQPDKIGQPELVKNFMDATSNQGPFFHIVDVNQGKSNDQITSGKFIGLNKIYPQFSSDGTVDGNINPDDIYIGGDFDAFPLGFTLHNFETEYGPSLAIIHHIGGFSHDEKWYASCLSGLIPTNGASFFERPTLFVLDEGEISEHRYISQVDRTRFATQGTLEDETIAVEETVGKGIVNFTSFSTSMAYDDLNAFFQTFKQAVGNLPEDFMSEISYKRGGETNKKLYKELQRHAVLAAHKSDYPYQIRNYETGEISDIENVFPEFLENQNLVLDVPQPQDFLSIEKQTLTKDDIYLLPKTSAQRIVIPATTPKVMDSIKKI